MGRSLVDCLLVAAVNNPEEGLGEHDGYTKRTVCMHGLPESTQLNET